MTEEKHAVTTANQNLAFTAPKFALDRPRTRMVVTIGPATRGLETIKDLMRRGVSVIRMNLSHGTRPDWDADTRTIRQAAADLNIAVGILADLPGPKRRTGAVVGGGVNLVRDALLVLTSGNRHDGVMRIAINPGGLEHDVKPGALVWLDDGKIKLRVERIEGEDVVCRVAVGELLKGQKGVATPGSVSNLGYMTDETVEALKFAAESDIDFVGVSYCRSVADLDLVRKALRDQHHRAAPPPALIAKIELGQAVDSLDAIVAALEANDGLMVARGDLGVELPIELVPGAQKKIIQAANRAGKVVITATQMLESMTTNDLPLRAEVTDVYNAVLDGTDAVMLSGETSIGKYPLETVEFMAKIAKEAEKALDHDSLQQRRYAGMQSSGHTAMDEAIAHSAFSVAKTLQAKVIVAFTEGGSTAARVASFRPRALVLALVRHQYAARRLSLRWGVMPIEVPPLRTIEVMFYEGSHAALLTGLAAHGDQVVVVMGVPIGFAGNTNLLRVMRLPEPRPTQAADVSA
ncbi:MAG: pyruvate kinase [Dehalococcoidia bacterium]|nr:pyruvate kinase [Dehalococcoidia bacterium]